MPATRRSKPVAPRRRPRHTGQPMTSVAAGAPVAVEAVGSGPGAVASPLRPLTAQDLRRTTYPVEIRPGRTIRLRRASVLTLLFTGKLPLPIFGALSQLQTVTSTATLMATDETQRDTLVEAMRWYACAVVASPVVVMAEDGDSTHVPVEVFTIEELFTIAYADAPADVVEDDAAPVPAVTEHDLARFPGRRGGGAPGAPSHTGQDVRTAAVDVGVPAVDLQHG